MQTCPKCGQENPAEAKFCNACGAPLAGAAPTLAEERKIVTILFVDLVGFTARAERLDPEDVRAIQTPYFSRVRTAIESFGGTVEKYIGDAVMAVFGAPVAHGDDPERAVRAALALLDAVQELNATEADLDLQVRIAVNTGEALVSLSANAAQEGIVAGDVVNTAARLQTAAPVNGILVGEETHRATRSAIEYEDADPVIAKGKQACGAQSEPTVRPGSARPDARRWSAARRSSRLCAESGSVSCRSAARSS
jgi:class 3 adenylate cyclase